MLGRIKTSFDNAKTFVKEHQTAIATTGAVVVTCVVTRKVTLLSVRAEMLDLNSGIEMAGQWLQDAQVFIDDYNLMDEYLIECIS